MAYNTGATFYPGGEDSYYMPELVSPAPQRLNEHPVNIEQNVANMEQQVASRATPNLSLTPAPDQQNHRGLWSPVSPVNNDYNQRYAHQQQQQQFQVPYQHTKYGQALSVPVPEQPNFSPFPRIQNRGPNVPATPEEHEAQLEAAREAVLASDDVEMQLMWAQDALAYCEVAIQNEQRICQTQPARPRTPRVEHMLREDAMKIVEFLADQHQPKAEFMRGMWLEFGKFGYRVDKREAFNCYTRSSEKGYVRAFYRIGMQFENSNDALKAIKYYQIGVSHGDSASSYRLGMMTLLGQHGQMQDFPRGLQLIRAAADGADDNAPQGAYVLGMLQAGELAQISIPAVYLNTNISEAKINVEKAAFLGFAKAQVRMGTAFELGDFGCSFDPALSLHYNSLAARQGEADAEMAISKWFLCGHEGVFAKNEEMAFTYAQRAAVSGLATAQFAMGYFYEVGIYVASDLKQAREWYQKAAESGNEDATKRITAISRSKTISRKDHENVALQRIRQQHAAGGTTSLPPVREDPGQTPQSPTLNMPDPSRLSLNPTPSQRPGSVAPYPTDGAAMPPNPNFRPASAFGINPALQQRPPSAMQGPPQRPYSSMDPNYGMAARPQGPPGPAYGNNYGGPAYPPPKPNPMSPPLGAGGFSQSRPGSTQQFGNPQTPPLKANIGFSAPLDPTGPDRRNDPRRRPVPQQGPPPSQQQQQQMRPPPKNPGYQAPAIDPMRPPSNMSRPPRMDSVQPARLEPSRPPRADSMTPKPNEQKPVKVSASAAASQPPGKGPKTFEEMGVPQAPKESDCVVM